jgi:RHS repeat-associated protein
MPGRTYRATTSYRYGFNGKENDNEVKGVEGSQQDYGMRIYDPRLGRFLSVDPLAYSFPYFTPYQFSGNMPIAAVDLDGLEQYVVTYYKDQNNKTTKIEIRAAFSNDGKVIDQQIHKYENTEKIAKGDVLVFEIKKNKEGKDLMSVVEARNKPNGSLTPEERKIFSMYKGTPEKESGESQELVYPNVEPDIQFESRTLDNNSTRTYKATYDYSKNTLKKLDYKFEDVSPYLDKGTPIVGTPLSEAKTKELVNLAAKIKNDVTIKSITITVTDLDGVSSPGERQDAASKSERIKDAQEVGDALKKWLSEKTGIKNISIVPQERTVPIKDYHNNSVDIKVNR